MRRLLVVLALVATACGGVDVSQSGSPSEPVVDGRPDSTSAADEATGEAGDSADGRPAPEFVLALGEGGEFSPSYESRPIYMVFWAEW